MTDRRHSADDTHCMPQHQESLPTHDSLTQSAETPSQMCDRDKVSEGRQQTHSAPQPKTTHKPSLLMSESAECQ